MENEASCGSLAGAVGLMLADIRGTHSKQAAAMHQKEVQVSSKPGVLILTASTFISPSTHE